MVALLLLALFVMPVLVPPGEARYGFRVTVSAPEFTEVGSGTSITGTFKNGLVPASLRTVWLMHGDVRLAESSTSMVGTFSFHLDWPLAGPATLYVLGDPYATLETQSDPFTLTGVDTPAAPPETVAVTDPEWGTAEVSWTPGTPFPGTDPERWRVYRAPHGTTDWSFLGEFPLDVTRTEDAVETGTWYHYAVNGWNRIGEGDPSVRIHRTAGPNATAVSPPSVAGDPGVSWRRIVLSWPFPEEPLGQEVETFRVYRRLTPFETMAEGFEWTLLGEVPRSVTSFKDRVPESNMYDYAVAGRNRHGEGPRVTETFHFPLPPADTLRTEVVRVRVCTSGENAGTVCWDALHGGRYATYDDARVTAMAPVASFELRDGGAPVGEAPVDLELRFRVVCDGQGCPSEESQKTAETDLAGTGLASFDFGAFADPVDTCYTYEAVAVAWYADLVAGDPMKFHICD